MITVFLLLAPKALFRHMFPQSGLSELKEYSFIEISLISTKYCRIPNKNTFEVAECVSYNPRHTCALNSFSSLTQAVVVGGGLIGLEAAKAVFDLYVTLFRSRQLLSH